MSGKKAVFRFILASGLAVAGLAVLFGILGGSREQVHAAASQPVIDSLDRESRLFASRHLELSRDSVQSPSDVPLAAPLYSGVGASSVFTVCKPLGVCDFDTVWEAVDAVSDGDIIKVAQGVYSEVHFSSSVVYITKTLTLRGGYTTTGVTGWNISDPDGHLTVLDGRNINRVVYIGNGGIAPIIEGFHIRNGRTSPDPGAGVYIAGGEPVVRRNRIYDNQASSDGGGIYVVGGSPVLENNYIYANTAASGGGAHIAGSVLVRYNTFYDNHASNGSGGGLFLASGTSIVSASIVVSNSASQDGGGIYRALGSDPIVKYNNVFGNGTNFGNFSPSPPANNISQAPLFVDLSIANFHLQAGSPCIGRDDIDYPDNVYYPPDDYDGFARPFGSYPDIGASEFYYTGTCFVQVDSGRIYTTVQEAATDSPSGGEVKIAGLCTGDGDNVVELLQPLTLRGGYTLTNWSDSDAVAYPTILDGEGTRRVIRIGDATVMVEGLHIRNGTAVTASIVDGGGIYVGSGNNQASMIRNNWIYSNSASYASQSDGGGIYVHGGSPTIQGNVIYSNTVDNSSGGGIYVAQNGSGVSTIMDNWIHHNTALYGTAYGNGGGIHIQSTSVLTVTIQGNEIDHNSADRRGGGISVEDGVVAIRDNTVYTNTSVRGGGMYVGGDRATVEYNRVYDNRAETNASHRNGGGGIYAFGTVIVQSNIVSGNVVIASPPSYPAGGGGVYAHYRSTEKIVVDRNLIFDNVAYQGGGIYYWDDETGINSLILIQNNLIYTNTSLEEGGGICGQRNSVIDSNTIYDNRSISNEGGGVARYWAGSPIVRNNIVANNAGYGIYGNSSVQATFNNLNGNTMGICTGGVDCTGTNINLDPQFENPAAADFHLQVGSPCIDAVTTTVHPEDDYDYYARPFGQYADMGAHEFYAGTCFVRLSTGGRVYSTVQAAVITATAGVDNVLVAGLCEGADGMVTIDKALTLSGGYTKSNWIEPTYPTILDAQGGGGRVIEISAGSVTVERFIIQNGNAGGGNGGGINVSAALSPTIQNIIFYSNSAANGGGFASSGGNPRLYNNTFVENSSGLYLNNSGVPDVMNNIVVSNTGSGIHAAGGSAPVLAYNNVWGNGPDYGGALSEGDVTDISEPPDFVDPTGPVFRLDFDSPCVHAGDPGTGVTVDFEGDARPDGTGQGQRYDIGADEAIDYLGVSLGPDGPGRAVVPNEEIAHTYYLTNTGTRNDNFAITNAVAISGTSTANDWIVTYDPAHVLSVGEMTAVPVTVIVPDSGKVLSGTLATIILTATYQSGGEYFFDVTTRTYFVQNNWGFDVSSHPDQTLDPGDTYTYTHVLTNNGNTDSFTLAMSSHLGWVDDVSGVIQDLDNNQSVSIDIIVRVPITASGDAVEVANLLITSTGSMIANDPFYALITDTTSVVDLYGDRYVATDGSDDNEYNSCRIPSAPCASIGHALGQVNSGEIIRVQEGIYYEYNLSLDTAYVLRGGYSRGDWTDFDPLAHTTIIDAEAKGRVLQINGNATVEGFTLQNGKVNNDDGGGVYIAAIANPTLHRNVIIDNQARHGAGVYNAGGAPDIWNNFIYDNVSDDDGGGFYNSAGNPRVWYNTFVGNTADRGGGVFLASGAPDIRNTIILTNTARDADGGGGVYYQAGSGLLGYNDVFRNTPNDYEGMSRPVTDFTVDPLFADAVTGDFHLLKASPCRDLGDDLSVGSLEDIDGQPRIMNDIPDIGADEYQRADVALFSENAVQTRGEGVWVTYTHLLTNTGNWNDSFVLTYYSTLTDGWTVAGIPLTTPVMAKDAYTSVAVLIQVPGDILSGTVNETVVTATSQLDYEVSDSALNLTIVERDVDVFLEPNRVGWTIGSGGGVVIYTHTLTNEGNYTDTFDLDVFGYGGTGSPWIDTLVSSTPVELPMGASTVITVQVLVPDDATEATVHTTLVTATSRTNLGISISSVVTNSTVADRKLVMDLSPDSVGSAYTNDVVYHKHVLTNSGNYTDTYILDYTSQLNWPARVRVDSGSWLDMPVQVEVGALPLNPGQRSIEVQVSIPEPPTAFGGQVDTMLFTATSVDTPTMSSSVTDVTTATKREGVHMWPEYDTLLYEDQNPTTDEEHIKRVKVTSGFELVTFTHELRNWNPSNTTDTFTMALSIAPMWDVSVTPTPTTGMIAWSKKITDVVVTITVPAAGDHLSTAPTATVWLAATSWVSPTGPNGRDTVTDVVIVNQWVEVDLDDGVARTGPPNGPPGPDADVVYEHTVTNNGNYTDSFTLESWASRDDWVVNFEGVDGSDRTPDIGPGMSHVITVEVTVPFTKCGATGTVAITATSRTPEAGTSGYFPTDSVQDNITIDPVYYAELSSALERRYVSTNTTTLNKTFTHWLTNTGNCDDNSFNLSTSGGFGPLVAPASPVGPLLSWLDSGHSPTLITVTVTVPQILPTALVTGSVVVTADGISDVTFGDGVSLTNMIIINQQVDVSLTPSSTDTIIDPGTVPIQYAHTLVNDGNYEDSFDLTWENEDGWDVWVSVDGGSGWFMPNQQPVATSLLASLDSMSVHVRVFVPPDVYTVTNQTWLTATSRTPDDEEAVYVYSPVASIIDTTVVRRPHVTIDPELASQGVAAGGSYDYNHTLQNTGGLTDSYTIDCTNLGPGMWLSDCVPTMVTDLAPGQTRLITVSVSVLSNTLPGNYDVTVISVTSNMLYPIAVFDVATDTTNVQYILGADLSSNTPRSVDPDTIVVFTHMLTNTGNYAEVFTLTAYGGFNPVVEPQVVLLSDGETKPVTVTVNIPAYAPGGQAELIDVNVWGTRQDTEEYQIVETEVDTININYTDGTRYVDPAGNDENNNCTRSGGRQPCQTVQHAVNQALHGDTVKVAQGTYVDVLDTSQVVRVDKSITLIGGFANDGVDWDNSLPFARRTRLDAEGQAGHRGVMVIETGITPTIEGFDMFGGFTDDDGAGLYITAGTTPTVILNRIYNNTSVGEHKGGGIYFGGGSNALIERNAVYNNQANQGGGLYLESGKVQVWNNVVYGNVSDSGGGLFNGYGTIQIWNNTFYSNTANRGGGLFGNAGRLIVSNTIVANNTDFGIRFAFAASYTLDHNNVWGNSAGDYSWYQPVITDAGSISQDPRFAGVLGDTTGTGLRLTFGSPCINSGALDSVALPAESNYDYEGNDRTLLGRRDIGAYEYGITGTKTVQPWADIGTIVTYTIRMTGTGDIVHTIRVTDTLPEHLDPTGWLTYTAGHGDYLVSSHAISWTGPVSGDVQITFTGRITTVGVANYDVISNVAWVDYGPAEVAEFIVQPVPGTRYVTLGGNDEGDCRELETPCLTVQYAVNQAQPPNDVVKVAQGTYFDTVYISRTIVLRGGYPPSAATLSDWSDFDPGEYVTTLDAQGSPGVVISGSNVALSGLHIVNGTDGISVTHGGNLDLYRSWVLGNITGVWVAGGDYTLINSIIAQNTGSGLYASGTSTGTLIHDTFADNGTGANIAGTALITNTIFSTHTTAIAVATGSAELWNTLWWENTDDAIGNVISYTSVFTGNPQFIDSIGMDYHILEESGAVDAGASVDPSIVSEDIDGEARVIRYGPDIGADEYPLGLAKIGPEMADPGQTITYTIELRAVDSGLLITDELPIYVTFTDPANTLDCSTGACGITEISQRQVITWAGDSTSIVLITYTADLEPWLGYGEIITNTAMLERAGRVDESEAWETEINQVPGTRYVATDGFDARPDGVNNNCLVDSLPCATVQQAVDQAMDGDTIRVSGGVYTSTVSQVVLVDKAITLLGGCTMPDWTCDPDSILPTYLDGEGSRRVMHIEEPSGMVTVSGFHLLNGSVSGKSGSGVRIEGDSGNPAIVKLIRNRIYSNTAISAHGGGIYLLYGDVTLTGNRVYNNTSSGHAGGMYASMSDLYMTNNVIAGNVDGGAGYRGDGMYLNSPLGSFSIFMSHNTIADNGAEGMYVRDNFTMMMTNTIVSGHTDAGINEEGSSSVVANYTLWHNNGTSWTGGVVDNNPVASGDPLYRDPSVWDYGILPNSAAFNVGVPAGVDTDIHGEPRPMGLGYDVGADELRVSLSVFKEAYPVTVEPGDKLTYTIYVTNTGLLTLTADIVDTLPTEVTPSDPTSWSSVAIDPEEVWMEMIAVTVYTDVNGIITNVVHVDTDEGPTGTWTATVMVTDTPDITVDPLWIGVTLNPGYTNTQMLEIGNVGRADLIWNLTESSPVNWLEEWPVNGSIAPSGMTSIDVDFVAPSTEGVYTTTLRITSNDPDELTVDVSVVMTVTTSCIPTSGAYFDFAPATALTGEDIVFTGSADGTLPITYTWNFDDGSPETSPSTNPVITYSYNDAMTYTVMMTATNCVDSFDSISRQVPVLQAGYSIYLPVVMRMD
ncbi:MAG: PKD domain-containing protein [Chloroflexi bacterium]|nr:PKD domain-containing protein [Chloroflexota bacterium]